MRQLICCVIHKHYRGKCANCRTNIFQSGCIRFHTRTMCVCYCHILRYRRSMRSLQWACQVKRRWISVKFCYCHMQMRNIFNIWRIILLQSRIFSKIARRFSSYFRAFRELRCGCEVQCSHAQVHLRAVLAQNFLLKGFARAQKVDCCDRLRSRLCRAVHRQWIFVACRDFCCERRILQTVLP